MLSLIGRYLNTFLRAREAAAPLPPPCPGGPSTPLLPPCGSLFPGSGLLGNVLLLACISAPRGMVNGAVGVALLQAGPAWPRLVDAARVLEHIASKPKSKSAGNPKGKVGQVQNLSTSLTP